jgi:hypothetical protein
MYGNHPYLPYLNAIIMGNLRQSMTEKEWNEMGHLVNIINTDNETDLISKMLDNIPVANIDNFCDKIPDKKRIPDNIPDKNVSHPQHYGGADNPYEAIKVIEAWELDFCLGNVLKYISRAGKKGEWKHKEDLEKAAWYLNRAIENVGK